MESGIGAGSMMGMESVGGGAVGAGPSTGTTTVYHANYVRNSRAIGVLWGIFTICFAIINVVVFINPQWIGDTGESPGTGYFGLWRHCQAYEPDLRCEGELSDFASLLNGSFKASTVFIGLSALFILLCILLMLLFFFLSASTVYSICCWFQAFSALCMGIGCIIYPSGWDDNTVKSVCGPDTTRYEIGSCEIRWAYILAIIGIFDAVILAVLAFVLATKHVKLLPEPVAPIVQPVSTYRGELNHGYHPAVGGPVGGDAAAMSTMSKKSLNLQPVMTIPAGPHHMPPQDQDRFSEYSHGTARSRMSKHNYASSVQDFQL